MMTGQLGCFLSSTLDGKANDYVKTLATPGFDCIIRHALSGAGRTTFSQPGHYLLSNRAFVTNVLLIALLIFLQKSTTNYIPT